MFMALGLSTYWKTKQWESKLINNYKIISNSWGKHKVNQYHDFIPYKTYWRQKVYKSVGCYNNVFFQSKNYRASHLTKHFCSWFKQSLHMQMNKKYVYATNLHQFQSFTFLHITLLAWSQGGRIILKFWTYKCGGWGGLGLRRLWICFEEW